MNKLPRYSKLRILKANTTEAQAEFWSTIRFLKAKVNAECNHSIRYYVQRLRLNAGK